MFVLIEYICRKAMVLPSKGLRVLVLCISMDEEERSLVGKEIAM